MKYLLIVLLFACNDGGSEPEIIKADSSAVDPTPRKDTVKIDTAIVASVSLITKRY